uniref:DDE Tnp4 domain-containing protein n=1 Tax=Lygus hesperus TaxID=30085 RepID=A0A146LP44_LYGHE
MSQHKCLCIVSITLCVQVTRTSVDAGPWVYLCSYIISEQRSCLRFGFSFLWRVSAVRNMSTQDRLMKEEPELTGGSSNNADGGIRPDLSTTFTQTSQAQSSKGCQRPEGHVATMSVGAQTASLVGCMDDLKAQIKQLEQKLADAKKAKELAQLPLVRFEQRLELNEEMCIFYTGFDKSQMRVLMDFVAVNKIKYFNSSHANSLGDTGMSETEEHTRTYTRRQEIIMLLMTLRVGLRVPDIAYQFDLTTTFVMDTVVTWIRILYIKFDSLRRTMFASREIIHENLPARFRIMENIRVIIDCVEIQCGTPKSEAEEQCDSEILYNFEEDFHHTNYKVLIGCSPNGAVTFVSEAMEASMSDKDILACSGLINFLEDGDLVLTDGGFCKDSFDESDEASRSDTTEDCGRSKNRIPAFLKDGDCLLPFQAKGTADVRAHRIFPQSIDKRLRDFGIFQFPVPSCMSLLLSQIVFICCCLLNFYEPLECGSKYDNSSKMEYDSEPDYESEFDSDMEHEDSCR